MRRLQGYSHRSGIIVIDLCYVPLFEDFLILLYKKIESVKVFAFLHLWKNHVQNGRSDSTPKIPTLWQAKSSGAKKSMERRSFVEV